MQTAEQIIEFLKLKPLPEEGGFYAETYRSNIFLGNASLPSQYGGARSLSTAIFYLLTPSTFSALHQLPGDEIFHFYLGDPVEMLQLEGTGSGKRILIGSDLAAGMHPQVLVPGGVWQGARLCPGGRFALMGTTMAPGFDFTDYVPGVRSDLLRSYPAHQILISALTR